MGKIVKIFLPIICAVGIIAAVVLGYYLFFGGKQESAVEFIDPQDNVTSSVSQSFVSLWIAVQKNDAANIISIIESSDEGWNMVVDNQNGETFKELFLKDCIASLKNLLAVEYLHDYYFGFDFSDEQQVSIEKEIDSLTQIFGSYDGLESELQRYGATVEDLEKYMCLMLKQSSLFSSLYNENGLRPVTDDEKKRYFKENYAIVYHIYFDTRGYKKEDGTILSYTEEELNEKKVFAEEIYRQITHGEISFEEALLTYSEDAFVSKKPNGYFVTDDGTYPEEFTSAAFSLLNDEITMVETSSGIHIIKRFEMDEELYDDDADVLTAITEKLITDDFRGLYSTLVDNVKVYDEKINELDVALIVPFAGL